MRDPQKAIAAAQHTGGLAMQSVPPGEYAIGEDRLAEAEARNPEREVERAGKP